MTDTNDRTEYPLASHGTPVVGSFDFSDAPIAGWDLNDGEPKAEFKKEFPFMFRPEMIGAYHAEADRLQEILRDNGIHRANVDEIALLFPDMNAAGSYIFDAVMHEDIIHFNASEDVVTVQPFASEYRVRYDFLTVADGKGLRIEAMHMTDGISPLHAPLYLEAMQNNDPVAVHLSFKCESEAAYHMACGLLRDQMQMTLAQSCESSYGVFSYWRSDFTDLYVKPRFNKRDA